MARAASAPPDALALAKERLAANDCDGAYRALQQAIPEAAAISAEDERRGALGALHFYSALAASNCANERGARAHLHEFFRLHEGHSALDPAKYPRAFVTLFAGVQRSLEAGEWFERFYPGFDAAADAAEENVSVLLWSTTPAFQLLAEERERVEWSGLRDDAERAAFIERFWRRRDPDPATEANELRLAVARRVAFADRSFEPSNELRGAMSDRGRVLVLLGPPARVHRQALQRYETTIVTPRPRTPLTGTLERWIYFPPQLPGIAPKQQIEFRFITQPGYGEAVMQRDFWPMKALGAAGRPPQPGER